MVNKKAWSGSSCKYGPMELNKLFDDGVELYICQPKKNTRGGYSNQHSKGMIIEIYLIIFYVFDLLWFWWFNSQKTEQK